MVGLTKTVALEYARQGIRVNTVCPGAIETPMLSRIFDAIPRHGARMAEIEPVGRLGTADEIAAAILWLVLGAVLLCDRCRDSGGRRSDCDVSRASAFAAALA